MNFKYLFSAIDLFDRNNPSLKSILFDARRRLRYASPPPAMADEAERRGVKLLETSNFRDATSGWLEAGPIFFPVGRHPTDQADILDRLHWMLDCRRDKKAANYLWQPIMDALPARATAGRNGLYRCALNDLAFSLQALRRADRTLYDLLMAGRLGKAKAWLVDHHSGREALRLTRMMSIMWMFFDLQIISYRLFRAEFAALDQPLTGARYMTLAAIEKELKRLGEMATQCKEAFEAGQSTADLSRPLRAFLRKSDLWTIATQQLQKLNSVQPCRDEILAEIQRMLDRTAKWSRRLERLWTNRKSAFSLSFNKISKSIYEVDLAPMPQAIAIDTNQSSTAIQFGAPSVTLLLFAVTEAVEDLSRQPRNLKPERSDELDVGIKPSLFDRKTNQRLTRQIFTAFRDLYARPVSAGRTKPKKDEAYVLRNHATKAQQQGKADPGLEPLPGNPNHYPLAPFYFGAPAARLLAQGKDDEPWTERDPANYLAKPVDAATRGKGQAIIGRRTSNPTARDRIHQISRQFTTRLNDEG